MRAVLKIRRKGVVILPKKLREALGVKEEDEVVAEVVNNKIIMRPLKLRKLSRLSRVLLTGSS